MLGTLIHKILENLSFVKNDQRAEYISNELNQNDHILKLEDIELFRFNLTAIIKSSEFAYMFSDNAKSEIEIVHNKNLYRIDKLVEFEDYIEIIDFKTDLNLPIKSDKVMREYKEQMAIYEDALKIKYQDKKILKKLFYLRHKQIITI